MDSNVVHSKNANPASPRFDPENRRRGVLRTAWVVAGVALAIYVVFILSGILASGVGATR